MENSENIISLEATCKKKAAAVVASAFFNYPMLVHYFPDRQRRRRWLPWYMERVLNSAMRYGEVFVTPDVTGVMFILPPGHTRMTTKEYVKNGFLMTPLVMGFRNYAASDACEKFVADTQERLMAGRRHYYLWGLAVDPKAQRKGVGSTLLKLLTDRADAEQLPVYLETHNKNNVAYYERSGFQLLYTGAIPGHGLAIWCMLREAAANMGTC